MLRNVPLLVQLFFWYAIISENLPSPRAALNPLPGVFLSNRGIALPTLIYESAHAWVLGALLLGALLAWRISVWARRRQARTGVITSYSIHYTKLYEFLLRTQGIADVAPRAIAARADFRNNFV